jgi:hypothetical protein
MDQMENRQESPPSPTSSEASLHNIFYKAESMKENRSKTHGFIGTMPSKAHDDRGRPKLILPKMSFPQFSGKTPTIWKDKCENYFTIFDIPPSVWATYASMNMDENAAKWLQMYKKKNGLQDWHSFISAVEKKFGDNDHRTALSQLLELHQEESLETYISNFEDLQYQIHMHNSDFGELFFVTQFIKGLKLEIGVVV